MESYFSSFSKVISPDQQKEKKVVREAAHNIAESNDESLSVHDILIFLRIPGVIDRRERVGFPFFPHSSFTPRRTC